MKKISIVNNKGGCGKTTTVFNLAHYFSKQGLKTLTVDTDPQLNLSTNFGVNVNELNFSLGDYLLERSNEFEPEMLNENLHLISAGPEAEKDMEELKNQGPYYYQLLNNFLENLSENYDIIIFDTAPAFNAYTTSAIYTSSVYPVILPGINELLRLNATINFTQGLGKDISGIILIRIQEQLQEEYKDYLLKNIIRKNVALSECIVTHQSIFDYSKNANGAKDYSNLAKEIMKKEGIR